MGILYYLLVIISLISLWKIFEKAGVEGWKALIPFYNLWVFAEIVGQPGWLGLLAILAIFIPVIGILIYFAIIFYLNYLLAQGFGKDVLYAIGLTLLPFIFLPILAFGDDTFDPDRIKEKKKLNP